ncbi:MAG TPA: 2-oxoacid:acceptor oxidoreductase family protein, partial [bacterium]|nr:2-oxoacid:acceptor oxidoreductase family protein [bacterium]
EPLEGVRYAWYLKPGATAVVNTAAIRPAGLKITYPDLKYLLEEIRKTGAHLLADDFTEQAKQLGSVKVLNVLMAGVAAPFLPVDFDTIMKALDLTVPEKFLSLNQKVLLWGRDYTRARPSGSKMAGEPRGSHG